MTIGNATIEDSHLGEKKTSISISFKTPDDSTYAMSGAYNLAQAKIKQAKPLLMDSD